jgi:hypothetical protein
MNILLTIGLNMTDIININKHNIPTQSHELGALTVKTILYIKDKKYYCTQGIGEDEWVINNGRLLGFLETNFYFNNLIDY